MDSDPRFESKTFKSNPYANFAPLHYAAERGNVLVARLLLEAKADVNLKATKEETPLHVCISGVKGDDAKCECGSGVRVHNLQKKPEWNGRLGSLFGEKAASGGAGYPEVQTRWPVLLEDASEGVLLKEDNLELLADDMVDLLLDAGADVNVGNQVTGETRTSLHEAVRIRDTSLLQKVIAAKADLDSKDSASGLTALHLAARSKQHEAISILVQAKADLSQETSNGKTAAQLAETNGAGAATVAILRGEDAAAEKPSEKPQTLESLTAEQRAMLFID
jgi:ankyrin repeat protein